MKNRYYSKNNKEKEPFLWEGIGDCPYVKDDINKKYHGWIVLITIALIVLSVASCILFNLCVNGYFGSDWKFDTTYKGNGLADATLQAIRVSSVFLLLSFTSSLLLIPLLFRESINLVQLLAILLVISLAVVDNLNDFSNITGFFDCLGRIFFLILEIIIFAIPMLMPLYLSYLFVYYGKPYNKLSLIKVVFAYVFTLILLFTINFIWLFIGFAVSELLGSIIGVIIFIGIIYLLFCYADSFWSFMFWWL